MRSTVAIAKLDQSMSLAGGSRLAKNSLSLFGQFLRKI
jgi:hypothetical protein